MKFETKIYHIKHVGDIGDIAQATFTKKYVSISRNINDLPKNQFLYYQMEYDEANNIIYDQKRMIKILIGNINNRKILWIKLSWIEFQRFLIVSNTHWISDNENKRMVIGMVVSFILGLITGSILK